MADTKTTTRDIRAVTGNAAVAYAMKQIDPDVVAAYPITPQTTVMEEFSVHVANGAVSTELVRVESEHSAMSASIGAAAAGARTMTSTSSQGLALMWEELYIAAGLRLPIVMINVNRALSAPINIHCDHSDSMGARDTGWIQLFCENAQEAYDTTIVAVRLAEDRRVLLPVMVLYDGFTISHAIDRVEFLPDEAVKRFVGPYDPAISLLDPEKPVTVGAFDSLGGWYYEFKKVQANAIESSLGVMRELFAEFAELSGRSYAPVEAENADDADIVFVIAGSMAGSIREKIAEYRAAGRKIGLVKVRSFRPFPHEDFARALANAKAILVFDRSVTPGAQFGPLALEVRSALYGRSNARVLDFYYGLGGRDLELTEIDEAVAIGERAARGEDVPDVHWISLKNR